MQGQLIDGFPGKLHLLKKTNDGRRQEGHETDGRESQELHVPGQTGALWSTGSHSRIHALESAQLGCVFVFNLSIDKGV